MKKEGENKSNIFKGHRESNYSEQCLRDESLFGNCGSYFKGKRGYLAQLFPCEKHNCSIQCLEIAHVKNSLKFISQTFIDGSK